MKHKKKKSTKPLLSKKVILVILLLLIPILFITVFALQQRQTMQQQAATIGCGAPGDAGNEKGVGKYCTKNGGQCSGLAASNCSADFQDGPGLCSMQCDPNTANVCGTGAACSPENFMGITVYGCKPNACIAGAPTEAVSVSPSTDVPSPQCLGGCPTDGPTADPSGAPTVEAPTASVSTDPAPTDASNSAEPTTQPTTGGENPNGGSGNSNIIQLIIGFFIQLLQLMLSFLTGK